MSMSVDKPEVPTGTFADKGWLMAVIWLIFLGFPLVDIWVDDHRLANQIGSTVALVAFGLFYTQAFRLLTRWESTDACLESDEQPPHRWRYLGVLIVCLVFTYALTGPGMLTALAFVASYGSFHFRWLIVSAITGCSIVAAAAGLWVEGEFALGFLSAAVVAAVGGATALIRRYDDHERQQAELKTELAVTEGRERLARDVHDVVGHNLTATIVKVELARKLLDGVVAQSAEGQARLDRGRQELLDLEAVSRRSLAEIRATVGGRRTVDFDDELAAAKAVLADAGVGLVVTGDHSALPEETRTTLAWVIREGVTNVVRHARASECRIEIAPEVSVLLRIRDDGVGMSGQEGNGINGLRERLSAAGLGLQMLSGSPGAALIVNGQAAP